MFRRCLVRVLVSAALPALFLSFCGRVRAAEEPIVVAHFGDSTCITGYLPEGQRIDRKLNELLSKHYERQKIKNLNLGEGGDYVRRFVKDGRYQKLKKKKVLEHIDIALIRYGHNDRKHYGAKEFSRRLKGFCDRLAEDFPGVRIILETNSWKDPKHYGKYQAVLNGKWNKMWDKVRALAQERSYPLVDIHARKQQEARAGRWDQHIRNQVLSKQKFGRVIVDSSKDAEMKDVPSHKWLGDSHPNPLGIRIMAEEELKIITSMWPKRLPRAKESAAQIGLSAVDALIELLGRKDVAVRSHACLSLGRIGPVAKRAIPELERLLKDKDERVKRAAQQALRRIRKTKKNMKRAEAEKPVPAK